MPAPEAAAKAFSRAAADAAAPPVTPDYVLHALRDVAERCLQRAAPPELAEGTPGRFEPQAATRALELLGKHLGLFGRTAGEASPASSASPVSPGSCGPRSGVLVTPGMFSEEAWEEAARS